MEKIRIAIVGYGNLGRGVERNVRHFDDIELVAVFSRRDPSTVATEGTKVYPMERMADFAHKIDVAIMCGGSATDLAVQVPHALQYFSTVDSFDTHAKIPQFLHSANQSAIAYGHTAIVSVGWDPGLFSIFRALFGACLPIGDIHTFWGSGVSQGHSDAIRRIKGVKRGVQYTVPKPEAVASVLAGKGEGLTTRDKHLRRCFVVLQAGADAEAVQKSIVSMPNYFADYDTEVNFIGEEEFLANHASMPHGGQVICSGKTSSDITQTISGSLKLDSNPEFTSSVLLAYARAAFSMPSGAYTVLDVPLASIARESREELIKKLL